MASDAGAVPAPVSEEYARGSRRRLLRGRSKATVGYAVLLLFTLVALGPFVYMVSPALRNSVELFNYPPEWIPKHLYLGNFGYLLHQTSYLRWALNTLIFATAVTLITVAIDALAGYAFATLHFPGRRVIFGVILSMLMIPVAALLAPLYILVAHMGLINTYPGLILPMVVSPLGVFMMRQFISTLPTGLYEAARLDGASEWQIFYRIVLPLIKPGLVVLGIFTFMTQWVNFLWPLVATTSDGMRTLTVGISTLEGQFVTNWGVVAAAAVLTMVPITVIFLIFQRWFVQASMAGALKQ